MINYDPQKYTDFNIYRRRYIPEENILLKKDVIYHISEDLILTSWTALKERTDMAGGLSAYYPKLGVKVSKKITADGDLLYWYNDIMELIIEDRTITMNDMLLDILVYPDNTIKLVDADEFADAMETDLITKEQSIAAMRALSGLLNIIYEGSYDTLRAPVEELASYIKEHG